MSAPMKDGGPAFPGGIAASPSGDVYHGVPGMTLRDWFAGQALAAVIAVTAAGQHLPGTGPDDARPMKDRLASDAYALADAMLAARSAEPTP